MKTAFGQTIHVKGTRETTARGAMDPDVWHIIVAALFRRVSGILCYRYKGRRRALENGKAKHQS